MPTAASAVSRRVRLLACAALAVCAAATTRAYTFNKTIPVTSVVVDAAALGIVPGDVVGIEAGTRTRLILKNFIGTATQPIIIANKNGKVRIGGDFNESLRIENSKYFKLAGDGDPAHVYGIEVFRAGNMAAVTGQGVDIGNLSTNYEVCFLEIHHAGYTGLMSKTDPRTDLSANQGVFTQHDVRIHDNYIHDVGGEGIYAGSSFYTGTTTTPVLFPHDIIGLRIYNNRTERTGREGIQTGCAISDCEVYNNTIRDSGLKNLDGQNSGLQLGPGTTGLCYGNTIVNTVLNGIVMLGLGNNTVFNNVIATAGGHAIYCDNRNNTANPSIGTISGSYIRIYNNTFINPGQHGYKTDNQLSTHEFKNNIAIVPNAGFADTSVPGSYTFSKSNNIYQTSTTGLAFVNAAAHDYRITTSSVAANVGTSLAANGVTVDLEGLARPFGAAYDAGAFEAGPLSVVLFPTHPNAAGATNGSILASAIGGTAPYTYAWSGGGTSATKSSLGKGTYTVTVTDNVGTQRVRSLTLTEPGVLAITGRVLPELNNANDGSIALIIRGGTEPYAVSWSSGPTSTAISSLNSGFYTATVTDANGIVANKQFYVRDAGVPVFRVNCAGPAETDRLVNWGADTSGAPSTHLFSSGQLFAGTFPWAVENTTETPNNVLVDRRYDPLGGDEMQWRFNSLSSGWYEVQLYFNETDSAQTGGSRVFTTKLEGNVAIANLDVLTTHGYNVPAQYTFLVQVTDGTLNVDFDHVTGSPMVAGIAVHSYGGGLPYGTPIYRIDAGGNAQTAPDLNWAIDKNGVSVSPQLISSGQLNTGPNTYNSGGLNATDAPDNVFANYRYDPATGVEMQWEFPVPPGTYRLNLYYMERDATVTGPGQRLFDVAVEGTVRWASYDPWTALGGFLKPGAEALILDVTDGTLDLDFTHVNSRAPIISAISLHRIR